MPTEQIIILLLDYINIVIAFIGVTIITVSALRSGFLFFTYYFNKKANALDINYLRLELGQGIIFGLEFMVAADIITTVAHPTYFELGVLALLVIIRTILSHFLTKELELQYTNTKQ